MRFQPSEAEDQSLSQLLQFLKLLQIFIIIIINKKTAFSNDFSCDQAVIIFLFSILL